jgi:hypothetical protein
LAKLSTEAPPRFEAEEERILREGERGFAGA